MSSGLAKSGDGSLTSRANQRLKLTGAAILVFAGVNVFTGGPDDGWHALSMDAKRVARCNVKPFSIEDPRRSMIPRGGLAISKGPPRRSHPCSGRATQPMSFKRSLFPYRYKRGGF